MSPNQLIIFDPRVSVSSIDLPRHRTLHSIGQLSKHEEKKLVTQ